MTSCEVPTRDTERSASLLASALLALTCLMAVAEINAAPIYKTYDAQGNVVFTDQPVDAASAELLETPAVNVADPLPVAPETAPLIAPNGTSEGNGVTQDPQEASAGSGVSIPKAEIPAGVQPGAPMTATTIQAVQSPPNGQGNSEAYESQVGGSTAGQAKDGTESMTNAANGTENSDDVADEVTTGIANENVDESTVVDDGSVSVRVAIPVLPKGARPPVIGAVQPSTTTQVNINWPKPDEVILSTQSPIWVELDTNPTSLKALGLQAEVWVDDKLAVSGERPLLPLVLPEVGMHKLQVRLVDSQGNSAAESDSQLMDVRLGAPQSR